MKDILFPVHGPEQLRKAVEYGSMLSGIFDNQIQVVYMAEIGRYSSLQGLRTEITTLFEHLTDEWTTGKRKTVHLETIGIGKKLHEHILAHAAKVRAGSIAMKMEAQSKKKKWESHLTHATAYQVLLHAEIPVFTFLAVPGQQKMTDIVFPIDLSEGTLQKLKHAKMIAEKTGANIHLISVYHTADDHPMLDHLQRRAIRYLKKLPFIKKMIYAAPAPETIMDYAKDVKADLIVIMSKPSDKLTEPFIAPGAKKYIAFSPVPVLNIHPGVDWKNPA